MSAHALPSSSDSPAPGSRTCDASGMAMIHRFFRRGFAEGPDLVRGVDIADTRHATAVAEHLGMLSTTLHAHHEGEDERLWSTLEERSPSCGVHVARIGALFEAQPDAGSAVLGGMPPPVRLLWRFVGMRRYAAHRAELLGA